jgi:hypothetical protein
MRFLEDNAILPASTLNHSLTRRERPPFRPDEAVELLCDPPGLADYLGLWDKFKSRWQTSVMYSARMVTLEPELPSREEARVQTRDFSYGAERMETPG